MPLFRTLSILGLLVSFSSLASAQTAEIEEQVQARLAWLRSGGVVALPGPAASIAINEAAIAETVATVDRHLESFWAKNKIKPAELTTEAEFLRRVSLDISGRIPAVQEIRLFVANTDPKKRQKKVDELLNRAGYANNFSSILRQLWLPQSLEDPQLQFVGFQFEEWLRVQLQKNAGLDKIAREMLTAPTLFARGRNGQMVDENASGTAFGFNRVNEFKPENVAASASRLFMGVKMECAQCHDHPFAAITREQFWETAAFFAELQPVIANLDDAKLKREIRIIDPDPKKVKTVQARFFDDSEPLWKDKVSPRELFVDWLTSPKNAYFARNAVNRMWAHFFGFGFIDPIDEPGPENPELIPALVDDLSKAYIASGYDNQFLIRVITRTKAYHLSSRQADASHSTQRQFARMNVKAMTGEQLFDSLSQATGFSSPEPVRQRFRFGAQGMRDEFLTKFASTEKITERQTSILQALTLMNGKFVNDQTSLDRSRFLAAIADSPFMDANGKIEALFLASLSRLPSPSEAQRFGSYVQRGGANNDETKALADVFWALLNSSEFILNH